MQWDQNNFCRYPRQLSQLRCGKGVGVAILLYQFRLPWGRGSIPVSVGTGKNVRAGASEPIHLLPDRVLVADSSLNHPVLWRAEQHNRDRLIAAMRHRRVAAVA